MTCINGSRKRRVPKNNVSGRDHSLDVFFPFVVLPYSALFTTQSCIPHSFGKTVRSILSPTPPEAPSRTSSQLRSNMTSAVCMINVTNTHPQSDCVRRRHYMHSRRLSRHIPGLQSATLQQLQMLHQVALRLARLKRRSNAIEVVARISRTRSRCNAACKRGIGSSIRWAVPWPNPSSRVLEITPCRTEITKVELLAGSSIELLRLPAAG